MACVWRYSLILSLLILSSTHLFAAGPTREERAYASAAEAYKDKQYSIAETRLAQFLQTYRKSTNAPMAVLLLAQAEFYLKKYPAAVERLADPANLVHATSAGLADRYIYWRGQAQFAAGDLKAAAETFVGLARDFPDSPLALDSVVEAANTFAQNADWSQVDKLLDDPTGAFQRAAQQDASKEQVGNGHLLRAESKCARQNFSAAIQLLGALNLGVLTPEQQWKRAFLQCGAFAGRNDPDAALVAATNMLAIARAGTGDLWGTNLAISVVARAALLEQQGLLADAAAGLRENLTNNAPANLQQQSILKLAELAVAQTNLLAAETALEQFLGQFRDSAAASVALLTLAELHLRDYITTPALTNHLAVAQDKLNQLLNAAPNGPFAGRAFLARGWCYWLTRNYPESFSDFSSAAQRLPLSADLAVARFKMGDAQFALKDYPGAQTNYQAVLSDFSRLPEVARSLGARALYQILRARLELRDTAELDEPMRQMLAKYFTEEPVDSGMLLEGQGLSDFGQPEKAREVFEKFLTEHTRSPLLPQVSFAVARTYERQGNWPAVITNEQAWLQNFPTNELRPQVEYALAWAVSQNGDESAAFDLFSRFIKQNPANDLTPLAIWWMGDHYFRLGGTNLVPAELNYESIFQDYATNKLAFPAQLMAGRAAMGRFSYTDASRYFVGLINSTNCSEGLRDQARFGYCEARLRQISPADTNYTVLQEVTNILAQMTPRAATNIVGALAWSKTAECDLQMGALDAATNDYAQALSSPVASTELRARSWVGWGIVLEKKAEGVSDDNAKNVFFAMAMNCYGKVFYPDDDAAVSDAFWIKKAGMQMLALAQKTGSLKGPDLDRFITKLKTMFPQLQDSTELKRLAAKNGQ